MGKKSFPGAPGQGGSLRRFSGRVFPFVVKKDGSIGEVKVLRSVDKDLYKEAVRVVKSLPKFTPGRKPKFTSGSQNGQAVNVWYTLPVPFTLK
jgi:protein TonB